MLEAADLIVLLGAFSGGFLAGLTGFGTGLAAMPFWLIAVPPVIAAQLAVACGAMGQVQTIHTIWHAVRWRHVGHFLIAGLIGIPIGTVLLPLVPERAFKIGVGIFLIVFCSYLMAARGKTLLFKRRPLGDIAAGFAGGFMSGLAGLPGPAPTAWAMLHDWPRDQKRALFQMFNLVILTATFVSSAIAGLITWKFWMAFALAMPGTIFGNWLGGVLYRRLDTRGFDRIVLVVLMCCGVLLVWSSI